MNSNFSRIAFSIATVAALVAVSSCDDPAASPPPPAELEDLSALPDTVVVGNSFALKVRVVDETMNPLAGVTVRWATEDGVLEPPSSVTNVDGMATAAWTLSGMTGGQQATATVDHLTLHFNLWAAPGPLTDLQVQPKEVGFSALRDSVQLSVEATDEFGNPVAGDPTVSWQSTDTAVARVSVDGWVWSIGQGAASVTASVGALSDTSGIVVSQVPAAVEAPEADTLIVGDTLHLSAIVSDSNGYAIANAETEWSSLDTTIVGVLEPGTVVGMSAGATSIVVETAVGAADTIALEVLWPPAWQRLDWTAHDLSSFTSSGIRWVAALDPENIAVSLGESGAVVDYDGTAWTRSVLDCDFLSAHDQWVDYSNGAIWAVSYGTCVAKRSAPGNWEDAGAPPVVANLSGVHGVDSSLIYVSGIYGLLQYQNGSWKQVSIDVWRQGMWLNDVWAGSDGTIWAAGRDGVVLHFDREQWKQVDTGRFEEFHTVWSHPDGTIFVDDLERTQSGWEEHEGLPEGITNGPYIGPGGATYLVAGGAVYVEESTDNWVRVPDPYGAAGAFVGPEAVYLFTETHIYVGIPRSLDSEAGA